MTARTPSAGGDGVGEQDRQRALADQLVVTRLIGGSVCHRFNNLLAVADMCAMLGMEMEHGEADEIACVREALGRMHASSAEVRELVSLYGRFVAGEAVQALPDGGTELSHAFDVASRLLAHRLLRNTVRVEAEYRGARAATSLAPQTVTTILCIVLGAIALSRQCARSVLVVDLPACDTTGEVALRLRLRGERTGAIEDGERALAYALHELERDQECEALALGGAAALVRLHGGALECVRREAEVTIRLRLPAAT